ncbi:MAG TPA: 23S rRNA (uracil(1939)-C(5))-methyltransferase RlmD [Steroidobacteraceae bacterium]|nr:23S rRNA (uracil(1939)-C(5))-methyltransferase RlmD [Steroidobacteraceae bacterium]
MSKVAREGHAGVETGVVTDLTHDAEGVVREAEGGGKIAFVAGALPGERVSFRRRSFHKSHDEAALIEIHEVSPQRVTPRCAHFGVCGGCALQHLDPDAQIAAKQKELAANLERIGNVQPAQWLPPLLGPHWNYRRRARLSSRFVVKKDRSLVGFREKQGKYVADVQRCEVLAEPVASLIGKLADLLTGMARRASIPQIEVSLSDGERVLVVRVLDALPDTDLDQLREFEQVHGLRILLQPGGLDTIAPLTPGPVDLHYRLDEFDLKLEFGPTDFVQVNAAINQAMVARAIELLEIGDTDRVLDLYCGLGNFTLPLARRARAVVGGEGEAGLIARARANARLNGITNAEFTVADLSVAPDTTIPWMRGGFDKVLLDPPRVGAREVLSAVAHLAPRRVVYISCHTGSLARDLGVLTHELGFRLRAAGVLDMFPHTTHVESIAVLDRAS